METKVKVNYNNATHNYKELSLSERRKKQLEKRINNIYLALIIVIVLTFSFVCFLCSYEENNGYYKECENSEIHYVWVEE